MIAETLIAFLNNWRESHYLKRLRPLAEFTKVISSAELGRGVELLEPISAGTLLGIYPGEHKSINMFLEKEEFISRSVKSAYLHSDNTIIDPSDLFGYVPDRPELRLALINEPREGSLSNVFVLSSSKHVWYVAIEDIEKGKQLFTYYGNSYQRDYKSGASPMVDLSNTEIGTLRTVAKRHAWLRADILKVISEGMDEVIKTS